MGKYEALNQEIWGLKLLLKLLDQHSCNPNIIYLKEDLHVCNWLGVFIDVCKHSAESDF